VRREKEWARMRRAVWLIATISIALIIPGCAGVGGGKSERILLPSELIARADEFDGKRVTIRGYVIIAPEIRDIYDSREDMTKPDGACLGLSLPNIDRLKQFRQGYTAGVSGTFRKTLCTEDSVCLYWCSEAGVELDEDTRF
jgi:hypothetical protein